MANRCDQCVWPVGVVTGYGHLGEALNDVISGQCVLTSIPCFYTFFQLHHDQSSSLYCISFFP